LFSWKRRAEEEEEEEEEWEEKGQQVSSGVPFSESFGDVRIFGKSQNNKIFFSSSLSSAFCFPNSMNKRTTKTEQNTHKKHTNKQNAQTKTRQPTTQIDDVEGDDRERRRGRRRAQNVFSIERRRGGGGGEVRVAGG
jgi:hypothetical protein